MGPSSAWLSERVRQQRGGQHCCVASKPRRTHIRYEGTRPFGLLSALAFSLQASHVFTASATQVTTLLALSTSMKLLPAGDQHGNIRVWDLTANACSCELVPEVGTAVRSITVALDGSLVVAANNAGTCYVWRMMRGASLTTHFEPLHKLRAHAGQQCTSF